MHVMMGALKRKILELRDLRQMQTREQSYCHCIEISLITLIAIALITPIAIAPLLLILSPDIAALIITNKYDCDAILNTSNQWFGINDFLFIGSVSHIAAVTLFTVVSIVVARHCTCMELCDKKNIFVFGWVCVILMGLGFVSYSIIGSILYSNTVMYHHCSNILISWIVLKLVMYIGIVPLVWIRSPMWENSYDACGSTVYLTGAFFMGMIGHNHQSSNICAKQ
eukprot:959883_1